MKLFNPEQLPPRDSMGYTSHPDLVQFFDDDEGPLNIARAEAAGIEFESVFLEHDDDDELSGAQLEYSTTGCCTKWQPTMPGWALVAVLDSDVGPVAAFAHTTRVCAVCGCTTYRACPGGCAWADDTLCTSCVGATEPIR